MRAPERTIKRAKAYRRALTPPEARLWVQLKGRGLKGLHFRKQHPVGPFVLDFYCSEARLAVEVAGSWHETDLRIRSDARRDGWCAERGIRTLRIPAEAVRVNLEAVLAIIGEAAAAEGPLSHPAFAG